MKTAIKIVTTVFLAFLAGGAAKTPKAPPEITPIHITGNKFFHENDTQFFLKGIAYQRQVPGHQHLGFAEIPKGYVDSLAHPELCLPDIELLQQLHVNTIRVYQVDPDQSHHECMSALAEAGIYVLVDLLAPNSAINRAHPLWHIGLLERYKAVVDNFHTYNNLLGFIAGNEVVTGTHDSGAAPFVRAAVRDTRRYMRQQGYRPVPIGYASNDDEATRIPSLQYFTRAGESSSAIDTDNDSDRGIADFYGINMFEWCGYLTFATSGFRARTVEFASLPVPVFLSEFGCNSVRPRPFTETEALYGVEMAQVWSGGVAYELFENANHHGVAEEVPNGAVHKLGEFDVLSQRYRMAAPRGQSEEDVRKGLHRAPLPPPPALQSTTWAASTELPPTPSEEKCRCVGEMLSCWPQRQTDPFASPELLVEKRALYDKVCLEVDCGKVEADGSRGQYGELSGCAPEVRLAWAMSKQARKGRGGAGDLSESDICTISGGVFESKVSPSPDCSNLVGDLFAERSLVETSAVGELSQPKLQAPVHFSQPPTLGKKRTGNWTHFDPWESKAVKTKFSWWSLALLFVG